MSTAEKVTPLLVQMWVKTDLTFLPSLLLESTDMLTMLHLKKSSPKSDAVLALWYSGLT